MKVIVHKSEMERFAEFECGPGVAKSRLIHEHAARCGDHAFGPIPFMHFEGQRKDGSFKTRKDADAVVLGWHRIIAAMTARSLCDGSITFQVSTVYATK